MNCDKIWSVCKISNAYFLFNMFLTLIVLFKDLIKLAWMNYRLFVFTVETAFIMTFKNQRSFYMLHGDINLLSRLSVRAFSDFKINLTQLLALRKKFFILLMWIVKYSVPKLMHEWPSVPLKIFPMHEYIQGVSKRTRKL